MIEQRRLQIGNWLDVGAPVRARLSGSSSTSLAEKRVGNFPRRRSKKTLGPDVPGRGSSAAKRQIGLYGDEAKLEAGLGRLRQAGLLQPAHEVLMPPVLSMERMGKLQKSTLGTRRKIWGRWAPAEVVALRFRAGTCTREFQQFGCARRQPNSVLTKKGQGGRVMARRILARRKLLRGI